MSETHPLPIPCSLPSDNNLKKIVDPTTEQSRAALRYLDRRQRERRWRGERWGKWSRWWEWQRTSPSGKLSNDKINRSTF
jgi:hypothetical protein